VIEGRDIICISSIEWDFLWQGHQEIAQRLARAGNRIFYIENMGVRSPTLRDAGRVAQRLAHWAKALRTGGVREIAPRIHVCSPLVLPPFGSKWQRRLNRQLLLPLIRRTIRRMEIKDALIWTYLPTDTALDLINTLRTKESTVVYYCIADFAQLTPEVKRLRESEEAVTRLSSVVFAQGPELAEHCSQWNTNVHVFPFGVNMDAFPVEETTDAATLAASEPAATRSLARPVIGYIGGLHRHVDFEMLAQSARARPDWSWVFVGAIQTEVGELAGLPNVHIIGQRPHNELADFIRAFDVCIVPYVKSAYTETVVPTKINEYLAMGKPVVSTELPAVCDFNRQYNILLTSPAESERFLGALEKARTEPVDEEVLRRRREVAALGSWETRLEEMSKLIEREFATKKLVARVA